MDAIATRPDTEDRASFAAAIHEGFADANKHIPCRFLYDARGSELFEDITRLDEYYPTEIEIGILEKCAREIGAIAAPETAIIEFGSGSSRKSRILIDNIPNLSAYVPIDISDDALGEAVDALRELYPLINILPVHADFNKLDELPGELDGLPHLGFFPGSTIGNLNQSIAVEFLTHAGHLLGADSRFVVGVDLKKDERILLNAYNDEEGVTAAFNLNLLTRINRELGGDIDVSKFAHDAIYNEKMGRIEMHIVSRADQEVEIDGRTYRFENGERVHTESSHKYSVPQFHEMAEEAGWRPEQVWTDERDYFSVHLLKRS